MRSQGVDVLFEPGSWLCGLVEPSAFAPFVVRVRHQRKPPLLQAADDDALIIERHVLLKDKSYLRNAAAEEILQTEVPVPVRIGLKRLEQPLYLVGFEMLTLRIYNLLTLESSP
jgi:hypothetical protein